ncbi:hypothetical protein CTheo_7082 [Ceratobasidium theobromae]|uniref:VWFA domain-containing protein n=1 Tax=Ceratobasidium theobromae TaxID=1582974 RepID=A0A5N5QCZ0_9AGAM|nr:hypothetical protein CTheo_7082 [Ceratobasidium theobromae]
MDLIRRITGTPKSSSHGDGLPDYNTEQALQVLRDYDIVFLVDDSGSMYGSRWAEAGRALAGVTRTAAQYDSNGVDIYFLNSPTHGLSMTSEADVMKLFQSIEPYGPTPTGDRLDRLMGMYLTYMEGARTQNMAPPKPINFIVITDGVATDDVTSVIVNAANRLERNNALLSQLGIQFFQIGNDSAATKSLKQLDNELTEKYKIRDIVDTTPYKKKPLTEKAIIKVLLGGINRRVDKQGGGAVLQK